MTAQLSLDCFFKSSDLLPHPKGSLSTVIPSSAIASANKEVVKGMQQSSNKKYVVQRMGKCQSQSKKSTHATAPLSKLHCAPVQELMGTN